MFGEAQIIAADPQLRAAFFQAHSEKLFLEIVQLQKRLESAQLELTWAMSQARQMPEENFARQLLVRWAMRTF